MSTSSHELFIWSDEYTVGIQEVDEQHKTLVSLLNQLHDAILHKIGRVASREILDRLAEYTTTHFLLEESLMRVAGYPGFAIHKQQHEDLLREVQELQHKLDQEHVTITFELLHFLKSWLTHHIIESDKRFGAYLKKKGGITQYASWSQETQGVMEKKMWWKFW